MNRLGLIMLLGVVVLTVACAGSKVDTKRSVYNAMQQHQCIKDTGNPNCDPGHMSYDQYKEAREKLDKDH